MPQSDKKKSETRDIIALLGAFCFFLSSIEYLIPKPLPFMRIGLANLPIILALDLLPAGPFFALVAIKVLGQSLISGSLFSFIFLFSLLSSFSSAALMFILRKIFSSKWISFIGIGTLGAVSSNCAQLVLAHFFVFGKSTAYVAPPFLVSGMISGITLGVFCEQFTAKSLWYAARIDARKHSCA